jgi:hypothetical protein
LRADFRSPAIDLVEQGTLVSEIDRIEASTYGTISNERRSAKGFAGGDVLIT